MKNKIKKLTISLLALVVLCCTIGLVACGKEKGISYNLQDAPSFVKRELVSFSEDTTTILERSDGYSNGGPFGVDWNKNNAVYDKEEDLLTLSISKDAETDVYYGGEVRTMGTVGAVQYGYFGCEMKPSNVIGTASTFFTYTGETDNNPHDEIDIEFLGKDTTKVQFNYFVNNVGGHEYIYDLGFDASEDFHTYGFYWDEKMVVWYVDEVPVYMVNCTTLSHPQRVFANFWAGNPEDNTIMNWMGKLDDETLPASAVYKHVYVAYLNCSGLLIPTPDYPPEAEEFTASTLSFKSTSEYSVSNASGKSTITYENVLPKTYKNTYSELDSKVKDAEYVAFKIKNNGTSDYVKIRVDVQSETNNAAGIKAINSKAWMNGEVVKTDLVYGGSFFDVEAGEEAYCVIRFYGIPYRILFMLDSCTRTDKDFYAGSVTVSDFGYAGENPFVEEKVSISSSHELLKVGESVQLTAEGTSNVIWSVENPNVATVDNGLVTAVAEGTTTVTATCGTAHASCTIKVSNSNPKTEETLSIVSDENDLAIISNVIKGNGTYVTETANTYNTSASAISWSGAAQYESLYIKTSGSGKTIATADGYIEFFIKNSGHSSSTETGFFIQLSDESGSSKIGEEVKAYKTYNSDRRTNAGNDWYLWHIPFTLLGVSAGTEFGSFRIKLYSAMDENEFYYIDGITVSAGESAGGEEGGEQGGEQGGQSGENTQIDHSLETLAICSDAEDLFKSSNAIWINGTSATETANVYGTSTESLAWSELEAASKNMMLYAKTDKSSVTISSNGYLEFFIKDVDHSSSSAARASGVIIRLYNGDNSTSVAGKVDVKCYKDYNNNYRTDAGNGWSFYKIPLTEFGTDGASFDRLRISNNVAFDSGEIMYIDGISIVFE